MSFFKTKAQKKAEQMSALAMGRRTGKTEAATLMMADRVAEELRSLSGEYLGRPSRSMLDSYRGINPSQFIFDEFDHMKPRPVFFDTESRTVSTEGGALTREMLEQAYGRMLEQHGRPSSTRRVQSLWQRELRGEWNDEQKEDEPYTREYDSSVPAHKYEKEVRELRSQINTLRDENTTLKEEIEYLKMLTMEN